MSRQKQSKPSNDLMRYAGLAGQIFVSLGIAVFAGFKGDDWLNMPIPILVWVLPLLVLSMMIYKMIKETSTRNNTDEQK